MQGPSVEAFNVASQYLVQSVELTRSTSLNREGLGSWTLLELIAHANRAHSTVEEYLLRPQPPALPGSTYFTEEAIAERGREAVAALGADPLSAVTESSRRIRELVGRTPADATIGSPMRTMSLAEYLPSRTAELTLHGVDIRRAVGTEPEVPLGALDDSLQFVVSRALGKSQGLEVLLALSGRGSLPAHFSVY